MKPKWPPSIFEVFDKLVPRLSIYRAKMYANTLGQKQYLAGEVGENCLTRFNE